MKIKSVFKTTVLTWLSELFPQNLNDFIPGIAIKRSRSHNNIFPVTQKLIFIAFVWKNNLNNPDSWKYFTSMESLTNRIKIYFHSHIKIQLAIILASYWTQFPIYHQYLFTVKCRVMEMKTQFFCDMMLIYGRQFDKLILQK